MYKNIASPLYTALDTDKLISVNCTASATLLSLPLGGDKITIKKNDSSANVITVVPQKGQILQDATLQVETATVIGAITQNGNATIVVTASGMPSSPKTISVAVKNGDAIATTAGKIRNALNTDRDVTSMFTVSGTGATIVLTQLIPTGNDSTLNISIDNGTCTGLTTAGTSTNTIAGIAVTISTRNEYISFVNDGGNWIIYDKVGINNSAVDIELDNTGVTDIYTKLSAYHTAQGSTPTDLYFPAGTYKLSTNITQPANFRYIMANGAVFSVDSGVTLTLNGEIDAGLYQIFEGAGSIAGTPIISKFYYEWFNDITKANVFLTQSVLVEKCTLLPNGTDDTALLQACNGKNVTVGVGSFRLSDTITWNAKTNIVGSGIEKTYITLNSNINKTMIQLVNAYASCLRDLSLEGNSPNNISPESEFTSALLVYTTISNPVSLKSYFLDIHNISIKNAGNNGLTLLGRDGVTYNWNWLYHIDNIYINGCEGYGFYDASTDNTYSNFNVSNGTKATMFCQCGSNMYSNFKVDGEGGTIRTGGVNTSDVDGAGLILKSCTNVRFVNLDLQSAAYVGIKVAGGSHNYINGVSNNNGTYDIGNGVGLMCMATFKNTFDMAFYNVSSPAPQGYDVNINSTSQYNTINTESIVDTTRIINTGFNNIVQSHRMDNENLLTTIERLNGCIKSLSSGTAGIVTGFKTAELANQIGDNLKVWLNGTDFPESQLDWIDRSGYANNPVPTGFAFSTVSGNNGAGGVAIPSGGSLLCATSPTAHYNADDFTLQVKIKMPTSGIADYSTIINDITSGGNAYFGLIYYISGETSRLYTRIANTDGTQYQLSGVPFTIPNDTTTNYAITIKRNGDNLKYTVYQDGVSLGSAIKAVSSHTFLGTGRFEIFNLGVLYTVYDIKLYDRCLTAAEILQNYTNT